MKKNSSNSFKEVFSISSIIDDLPFFNTSYDYMMQRSRGIKAGLSTMSRLAFEVSMGASLLFRRFLA